jgi:hypothetical protein
MDMLVSGQHPAIVSPGTRPPQADRPGRLGRFLDTYGWSGTTGEFLEVVEARMTADAIDHALADLANFPR